MSSAIDLVVLNGPLEGEVVHLRPDQALPIGRAPRGLQLPDPLVSFRHAEIAWQGDLYWVEDLGSTTGTFIDEQRITDKSVAIKPGMRVQIGETEFEVRERPRSALLRTLGAISAVVILVFGVRAFLDSIEVRYEPVIRWFEPVAVGGGVTTDILRIPTSFIRETGVDHRELKVTRITDYDRNGVAELWLTMPREDRLVTFDVEGGWRTVSVLPHGCRSRQGRLGEEMKGFPDLDCAGTRYVFEDGRYNIAGVDGVFVWMPPAAPPAPPEDETPAQREERETNPPPAIVSDGPPVPFVVTLVRPTHFAGFLARRGVTEPVHYLLCEDAVPGVRAQVRTEQGDLVPLELPCMGEMQVDAADVLQQFGNGLPRMFAFTGNGRAALLRDVATHLAGDPEGVMMSRDDKALYDRIAADPTVRRGAVRVGFTGDERLFTAVAPERPVPGGGKALLRTEVAGPVPGRVHTVRVAGAGRYDLEGCGTLEVDAGPWHCLAAKGCGETSAFLALRNTTCGNGAVVRVPYARGVYPYDDGRVVGRVSVESIGAGNQIDVLRVRFAYREQLDGL